MKPAPCPPDINDTMASCPVCQDCGYEDYFLLQIIPCSECKTGEEMKRRDNPKPEESKSNG